MENKRVAPPGPPPVIRKMSPKVLNVEITDNNTVTMLGLHQLVFGRDQFQLADPFDVVSEVFPSGETADAIVQIPAGATTGTRFAVYSRNLNLRNGSFGGANHNPGGMMTFIQVS